MSRILKENMLHYEGIGLSANQIGISERVFVMMLNIETEETITSVSYTHLTLPTILRV